METKDPLYISILHSVKIISTHCTALQSPLEMKLLIVSPYSFMKLKLFENVKNQNLAYVYALLAVLFWSTVATAFKLSLTYLSPIQLLFYSSLSSLSVLFVILVIQKKLKLILKSTRRELLYSLFLGLLNPFLYYLVLFKAYSLLLAQEAQPLNYTWPLVLVILSILILKQKIKLKDMIPLLIGFTGVVIISTRGNILSFSFSNPLGIFLALSSSLIWATFWILNMRDGRDAVVKLFLNFLFGFIFVSIFTAMFSSLIVDQHMGLVGAFYVGLFEMGITFVLWLKALKLSKTTALIGNLASLSPYFSNIHSFHTP